MSGGTTSTTLRNLDPDTVYSVAVVPVYPDVDGIREEEKGKTSEWILSVKFETPDFPQFPVGQIGNFSPLVSSRKL